MKRSILITALSILVAGMTFAQSQETRSLSSFSKISAHQSIDVYIKQGSKEEARIVSDNIDLEDVLTEISQGKLKIHLDGNRFRNIDVDVYVTYKSLEGLYASSSASITGDEPIVADGDFDVSASSSGDVRAEIEADELSIRASSSGDVFLEVKVNEIEATVSSSGDIDVRGTAKTQDIQASSSGDYDGYDVESEEVEARVSSSGSIKVTVSNKIDGRASSGGSVRYKGVPKYVDVSSTSGGSVKKY